MTSNLKSRQKWVIVGLVVLILIAAAYAMWAPRPGKPGEAATRTKDSSNTAALTVNIIKAQTQTWPQQIQAHGAVTAWQEVVVSPETGGLRIEKLLVDVGSTVRRGQVLVQLSDSTVKAELRKQEALVAQARANLVQAQTNLKRAKAVDVAGALAPQKLDEYQANHATAEASLASALADLESARLKLSHTKIVAADDGVVSSKSAVLGAVVTTGAELFRLIRQGRVEWRAELDAAQLASAAVGQPAHVVLPNGKKVEGKVRLVSPTLDAATGRGMAYVSLVAGQGSQPGQFASGTIDLASTHALTLPQSAIVLRDGRSYVYVLDERQQVSSRVVVSGRRQGDRVEIVTGLDPNWSVVASGGGFLSDGAKVTVVSANAAETAGAAAEAKTGGNR